MKTRLCALFLIISSFFGPKIQAENKTIFLISPPRSLSTVFMRMMHEYEGFEIFHEPGYSACAFTFYPHLAPLGFPNDAPHHLEEVVELIENASERKDVFVKEMSFAANQYLPEMQDLLKSKNAFFVFLVRNPHHSLISYYKKLPMVHPVLQDTFDFKGLFELYQFVKQNAENPPHIILAEDLYTDPVNTIRTYCSIVHLPFHEEKLTWNSLGEDFDPKNWNDFKYSDQFSHWQGDAAQSTGFRMPSSYIVDENGLPTFEEIENKAHRKFLRDIYARNLSYYLLLVEESANTKAQVSSFRS